MRSDEWSSWIRTSALSFLEYLRCCLGDRKGIRSVQTSSSNHWGPTQSMISWLWYFPCIWPSSAKNTHFHDFPWISVHLVSFVKVFGLLSIHLYKYFVVHCVSHFTATTTTNRFMALFPGPPGWADARRELLDFMVQGKINRGRHTSVHIKLIIDEY